MGKDDVLAYAEDPCGAEGGFSGRRRRAGGAVRVAQLCHDAPASSGDVGPL